MKVSRLKQLAAAREKKAKTAKAVNGQHVDATPSEKEREGVMESEATGESTSNNRRRATFAGNYSENHYSRPSTASARAASIANLKKAVKKPYEKKRAKHERYSRMQKLSQNQNPTAEEFVQEQLGIINEAQDNAEKLYEEIYNRYQDVGAVLDKSEEVVDALKELEIINEKQKEINEEMKAIIIRIQRELEKQKKTNKNPQRKINPRDFMHQ